MDAVKATVYGRIKEYLNIEGYPTEADPDFKEANVSDLVLYTIGPVLDSVRKMGRDIRLTREKEITSVDNETGALEEFVVVDQIAVAEQKFVLIIEANIRWTALANVQLRWYIAAEDARNYCSI